VGQMERIRDLLDKRERVAGWYAERLANIEGVSAPTPAPYTTRMSWFVYVVRLDERYSRTEIMADLEQRGVAARPYFKPIHLQPYYMETFGYGPGDFPVTERISETTVALPFAGTLQEEQVDYVCATLDAVLRARD